MESISLTRGMKNALNSLNDLQSQIQTTNNRLATGKKVNSALDNALNFFVAQGFDAKASGLASIQDGIGLGINVIKTADKALNSMKTSLEQAEGTLRAALNGAGTNAKVVSNFSFRNAVTGAADGTQLLAEAAAGTSRNRLQVGDAININLVTVSASGTVSTVGTAGTVTITTTAGTTVQNLLDAINGATGAGQINDAAAGTARVRAYLNDGGNIVIESAVQGESAPGNGQVYGLQMFGDTDAGGTQTVNNLLDVFNMTGAPGTNPTTTFSATTAIQTASITGSSTLQATRAAAASSFREVLSQIRNTALDASFNGTNLLQGDFSRVSFNEEGTTSVITQGRRVDSTALGFATDNLTNNTGDAIRGFQSDREISDALKKIRTAKDQITSLQSSFSTNFNVMANRQQFTSDVIKNLKDGSDLLTLADINEEGANLTSLQTRQQLSVTALSLANQSDQAILRLF